MNRRHLLRAAAAGSAFGAGEPIRGAIFGGGGRGRRPTAEFKETGVERAAMCELLEDKSIDAAVCSIRTSDRVDPTAVRSEPVFGNKILVSARL